jgi:acetyl-CoA carboxylase biotin carboxyl carrier protein
LDLKQIKDLMTAMEKSGIKKLSLKEKTGFELQMEREDEHPAPAPQIIQSHHQPAFHIPHPPRAHEQSVVPETKVEEKQEGKWITSPMVGTFYATPSPDDPYFVKVGDKVNEDTLVCIIEAMKVMNEVKAGMSGTVAEISLESGHPVEFGTKLFRIV